MINAPDERPQVTRELLRRVLSYAAPYRWSIAAMLGIILLSTGLSLLSPLIMRDLIDHAIPEGDVHRLILLAIGLLILPILSGILTITNRRFNSRVGEGVTYDLRVALYSHLQRMSLRFFTNTRVGELMSRLNNDVVGAQNAISNTIVSMITSFIQAVAMILVMLSMEWRLTILSIMILPLFILASRLLAGRFRDIARRQMDSNAAMNALMNETLNISGALLVKLFGQKEREVERFQHKAADVRERGVDMAMWGSVLFATIGLVSAVGTSLVYGIGGYLAIHKAFTVGTIVAFGAYLGSLYASLQSLTNAPVNFATSMVSFERVFEVLDLPADIEEQPDAIQLQHVRGELVFENVSFNYDQGAGSLLNRVNRPGQMDSIDAPLSRSSSDTKQKTSVDVAPGTTETGLHSPAEEDIQIRSQAREEALDGISLTVSPGQLVALVGPSGAGKTTLTYLIPRLYDPTGGRILLDGHDLRDVTLDSLSAQIGMVTQETHLFHDTIRTNLLYARLDATQADLEAAARAANIHHFIAGLPDGYDTVVGERGYRLSGGEKQRLALARVILKDPRILVLDEATSSLDSESEELIQEALKRVMVGRTSIVIAHRLSTILAADLIVVMDRGKMVESGKHQDLLALNGLYAHLYQTQYRRAMHPLE
jgi:ATP-binding cassette subfamily B protein